MKTRVSARKAELRRIQGKEAQPGIWDSENRNAAVDARRREYENRFQRCGEGTMTSWRKKVV